MTEPTSTGALIGLATTVGLAALMPGINPDALIGAFFGGTLFVVNAKDLSLWKRLFYLVISVVPGYMGATDVMRWLRLESAGLAAFFAAACVVTITIRAIEGSGSIDLKSFRRGDPNG